MNLRLLLGAAMALSVSACALKPQTVVDAWVAHETFPTLAMAVADCLEPYPDTYNAVVDPFNQLVDVWTAAQNLPRDERLFRALHSADAFGQIRMAESAWTQIRVEVESADIDCGPFVVHQVQRIESTFGEIQYAIETNSRVAYVYDWLRLLSEIALNRDGQVVRIERIPT